MYSEEEKQAIEYLKNRLEILHNNTQWATENSIKVVLNLIKKQQKEIEIWKETENDYEHELARKNEELEDLKKIKKKYILNAKTNEIKEIPIDNNYISKDKIRAKIKEIKDRRLEDGECELALHGFIREGKIDILEELLEENNNE